MGPQPRIIPVFKGTTAIEPPAWLSHILPASAIDSLATSDFAGSAGNQINLCSHTEDDTQHVRLLGLGDRELAATAVRSAATELGRGCACGTATYILIDSLRESRCLQTFVEGFLLGVWEKSADARYTSPDTALHLMLLCADIHNSNAILETFNRAHCIAAAIHLARTISNAPAADLTPAAFEHVATHVASTAGLSITCLTQDQIREARLEGVLSVSSGSAEPPAFVTLEYKSPDASRAPIVLIGKGVTFDSGGLTLKPGTGLPRMKHDKAGAGVVLAVMQAIAVLEAPLHVIAIIPAVENMPGGKAIRPGDVLTMANDKTIEIISTDAEGRLILADALLYAQRFAPELMIDVATLCGATRVALGNETAAIFSNAESLASQLVAAGQAVDEPIWRLPLLPGYVSDLRSPFAHLRNSPLAKTKGGGACVAAAFLHEFVSTDWAHIDIAGVAWDNRSRTYYPREGASGFGVRLLIDYLTRLLPNTGNA